MAFTAITPDVQNRIYAMSKGDYTRKQICEACGVTQNTVKRYESKASKLKRKGLYRA